jgi:hypothetical protein
VGIIIAIIITAASRARGGLSSRNLKALIDPLAR